MNKKEMVFTPLAESNINEIWDYTAENWSIQQAQKYIEELDIFLENLEDKIFMAKLFSDILPELDVFRVSYQSHYVFFETNKTQLIILAIVHKTRDFENYIKSKISN